MSASIDAFRAAFPAAEVLISNVDEHHGYLRFAWTTVFGDGRADLSGQDYAEVGPEGRLRTVVSFDGQPAPPSMRREKFG